MNLLVSLLLAATFKLDVTVSYVDHDRMFFGADATNAYIFGNGVRTPHRPLQPGDHILARGIVNTNHPLPILVCRQFDRIESGNPPVPVDATIAEAVNRRHDYRLIRASGIVNEVFIDEIDSKYVYLILTDGIDFLAAAIRYAGSQAIATPRELVGRRVTATGIVNPRIVGRRQALSPILHVRALSDIQPVDRDDDPFRAEAIPNDRRLSISELHFDRRLRTAGTVLACRKPASVLLERQNGDTLWVRLIDDSRPNTGDRIEVSGFPESNLFRIDLYNANWRKCSSASSPATAAPISRPLEVTGRTLFGSRHGQSADINAELDGRLVTIHGIVRSLPSGTDATARFHLESKGVLVPVEAGNAIDAIKQIEIGSTISATGICVLESENWKRGLAFPHARDNLIVLRNAADLALIAPPLWWTRRRLFLAIAGLIVLLGLVILRSHSRANAARKTAALKFAERTRLAVELHDSLAQNLTGVALEIGAAEKTAAHDAAASRQHLRFAARALDSCREELRTCLQDLRSNSLEYPDFAMAIEHTLRPIIGSTALQIRSNVPREILSDNTAHNILRILRELVANAIRHGHAREIKIAGTLDKDLLRFSIRDNGSGFDPDAAPGIREGHFGLQGIRDRIDAFEGEFILTSNPGKGCRAEIALKVKS